MCLQLRYFLSLPNVSQVLFCFPSENCTHASYSRPECICPWQEANWLSLFDFPWHHDITCRSLSYGATSLYLVAHCNFQRVAACIAGDIPPVVSV